MKLYVNNRAQPVLLEISTINNKEINQTVYSWNNWYISEDSIHAIFGLQIDSTAAFMAESKEVEFSMILKPTEYATRILDTSIPIKYSEDKSKELSD